MSLEKSNITWSARQLKGMVMNGKINFNHIVQRSFVWEKSRKSGLIESMIIGYPIPPVFAKRLISWREMKLLQRAMQSILRLTQSTQSMKMIQ